MAMSLPMLEVIMKEIKQEMQQTPKQNSRTYTVEEIATILRISRSSAYKLVKQDDFAVIRIGNSIRVSKKSFDAWLAALEL